MALARIHFVTRLEKKSIGLDDTLALDNIIMRAQSVRYLPQFVISSVC